MPDEKDQFDTQNDEQIKNGENLDSQTTETEITADLEELHVDLSVENKEKEIEELKLNFKKAETEKNELQDRLLRKIAEFDNYKRRTETEFSNLFKYAAENFIKKILPVVDDFERSLKHLAESEENSSVTDGIKLIYEKLMKILDDQGVKKIDTVGKPFDVHFHEALLQQKDEQQPPHIVLDELETGYLYQDKVIRHSKVIVNEDFHVEDTAPDETTKEEQL
ncbi:MAG: nucleotide exchange factor GrpE [Ignavibacteria bacterium CG_4_8_14_3_um_filter_37_9]|nr:nucleotide exchange factor GrpE [Ignavibacteria bacterium]OIO22412.1 MAG: nucleotide exchange factor GrpE [Ignavibacteria bacterium CG1_02_37_35]PIP77451.1 MAG: nucleotide exchange factor GrpE [Ignavibacteria bacterium CG22_combo_CG10-13_8_21_14_all_37_15]PIS43997.1 MAG: nucleotide exchange factor GrpE [Ignavibacteria bacterium CG08_land_8_20_14_0_20_37_9]PIX00331.1 MAG: nucleotide exchange factor GrpE [Ignavibacteria bacterium CG_4_8_14_3_um_filter_37_9]PIX93892.1 MAG: nucleotide exchange 